MKDFLNGQLPAIAEKSAFEIVVHEHQVILEYLRSKGMGNEVASHLYEGREMLSNLWHNGSFFRFLLHKLQEKGAGFTEVLNSMLSPYEIQEFYFENFNIKVIEKSYLLDYLFTFFRHPDFEKDKNVIHVGFQSESERTEWYVILENALALIKNVDPIQFEMLTKYLDSIAPIYYEKALSKGNVISFTSDYSIGMIVYSKCPKVLTAETLIHETRHNVLFSFMKIKPLIIDSNVLVRTPLRNDDRPLSGLFHQAYVLCGLSSFYSRLLKKEEYSKDEKVIKRAELQFNDYALSLKIMGENIQYLTDDGKVIFQEMQNDLKQYLDYV